MSNLKRKLIITLSALFAVVLCVALIFSIRPSYASSVEILDTDGTSIYISGDGVTYDKNTNKYTIEDGSDIRIQIINEQRIFSSVKINDTTYNKSVIDIANVTSDLEIDVYSTAPNADGSDKGRYFTNPFVISEDSQLKALEALLAGRSTSLDDYAKFEELGTVTEANKSAALAKLQTGYFVLSENILLDTNEFYGIGTKTRPFAGCFDFRGYHVTLNILNEYKVDYDVDDNGVVYSGLFGYVKGNGTNSSMLKDIDVNGKIAFSGTTGDYSMYHYVGSIAGHVEPTTLLAGAHSEASITLENDTPLFVGGLFGSLKSPLNERFDFTYACNYGVLQVKSYGSSVNMSLGSLAGLVQDTFIYNFEDKSNSTHIVANNLGRDEYIQDSGTSIVGGIIGTVYANESDVKIKNVKMNIAEGKALVALIDSNSTDEYAVAGGVFGIFDSASTKKIYTDMVTVNVSSGTLEIKASTNEVTSLGSVYAAGFVGKLEDTGHELTYEDKLDATLFNGNVDIKAINSGVGPAYAGGMFSYNALIINNDSDAVEDMNKIVINSGINDSTLNIIAEQAQTSKKYGTELYEVNVGYFAGQTQNVYAINNFEITVNNAEIKAHRAVGSTAIGDICAGGFIGKATSDTSNNGYLSNINVNLNNSSVHSLSLSYESTYTDESNNSMAGGFVAYCIGYGKSNTNVNQSSSIGEFYDSTTVGLSNIQVNSNNFGNNSPQFTVRSVQNGKSGGGDYKTEGYVGGLIGLFEASHAENLRFNALANKSVIYFYGTNNPNTAAAGGIIGNCKNKNSLIAGTPTATYGLNGGFVNNAHVIAKGYVGDGIQNNNSGALTYDLYAGGAIGIIANVSGTSYPLVKNVNVFNTSVQTVGENDMSTYAGGVVGGIWWKAGSLLIDSNCVDCDVTASSITAPSYAGGIAGYTNRGSIIGCSAINTYVKAESIDANAAAAGILAFKQESDNEYIYGNFAQTYVSASGSSYTTPKEMYNGWTSTYYTMTAGIAVFRSNVDCTYVKNNYFDLPSFDNDYLGENNIYLDNSYASNRISMFCYLTSSSSYQTVNSDNNYISFSEKTGVGSTVTRYSSLSLSTGQSANLYVNAGLNKGIINNKEGSNRFYLQFTGDTDCLEISKTGASQYTTIKANSNSGLVVSNVWFNIYGLLASDVTNESLLTHEKGWYRFSSYAIKINNGRPVLDTDEISISLEDNENGHDIALEYSKDIDNNYLLNNGIKYNPTDKYYFDLDENGNEIRLVYNDNWYVDSNNDGVYNSTLDTVIYLEDDSMLFNVTDKTNIAGYYNYSSDSYNIQYALINIDQSGFTPNSSEHVASSIRVNALLTNTAPGMGGYKNFPKYSFYDSTIANLAASTPDLDYTKWVVPADYDYSKRIDDILTDANRTIAYSSNFNGRLAVERDIDNYALVITPDAYLKERTIITIEFENKKIYGKPYVVILEFVPNDVYGLRIVPGEDTPPLETIVSINNNGTVDNNLDDFEEYTYVYVGGDTARFDAFDDKRYSQLSFLASVRYSSTSSAVNANGTVNVPLSSDALIPVTCELVSGSVPATTVYIKVLSEINLNILSTGANYSSDRKAVQTTPFNFEFSSAPGFGLAPSNVIINTYSNDNYTTSIKSLNLANYADAISYSTTNSYKFDATGDSYKSHALYGFIVEFDHRTGVYSVVVPGSMFTTSVKSVSITLEFPVVYSLVFDTGIPNVAVDERYIVFEMKQGDKIDNLFYTEVVYPTVFAAIKDNRFGFSLHDYYLTDDASSIHRYGETIATMVTPKTVTDDDGNILYYCFIDNLGNEIRVVQNDTTKIWYLDSNKNNVLDATEITEYDGWRTITGPYTFYASWTYDIALEVPEGVTISSPLGSDRVIELDSNDEDKVNGKKKIVPINTNNGFSFTITTDSSFYGTPRFKLFEVTLASDGVTYEYKDLTNYVSLIAGSTNSYNIPQYDDLGNSIINGVLFLKVFDEVVDYEVSDIGEFGKVSNNDSVYEDGIFTVTYNVNYSKVVVGDVVYSDGLVVGNNLTSGEKGLSFVFTDSNGNELKLPKDTSLRLYRNINGTAYDAGYYLISEAEGSNSISVSSFKNILTGGKMELASGLKVKSEEYNLVVTLQKNYSGFANDYLNAIVSIHTDYAKAYKQFDCTLTYGYDENGALVAIHPESYDVLKSPIRHSAFYEKAFDVFNIYNYNPASGLVNRVDAPTEQASGFTLQFIPSSGKQPNIFDHRHGSSYYLWEVEKTYSTDEAGATVVRQYIAKDAAGSTVSIVSETQHYYYYLATNGNLNLSNVPAGCKIRLLEVESITNPAASVVIYTYGTN